MGIVFEGGAVWADCSVCVVGVEAVSADVVCTGRGADGAGDAPWVCMAASLFGVGDRNRLYKGCRNRFGAIHCRIPARYHPRTAAEKTATLRINGVGDGAVGVGRILSANASTH